MAKSITDTVLQEVLKKRWSDLNNPNIDVWDNAYPFYFKDLNANLICKMSSHIYKQYENGSGSELKRRIIKGKEYPPKMLALKSSSAMTFNIFGNGDKDGNLDIIDNHHNLPAGRYQLTYEKKLPALNPKAPANIDVCLSSASHILFFEMKMTEWFGTPGKLRATYLNPDNGHMNDEFCRAMQNLMKEYTKLPISSKGEYKSRTKRFDVFQIMKHIFGIYNGIIKEQIPAGTSIHLVLGCWTVPNEAFFGTDQALYSKYKEDYEQVLRKEITEFSKILCEKNTGIKAQFKKFGSEFKFSMLTVEEIVACLKKSAAEMSALKRYL